MEQKSRFFTKTLREQVFDYLKTEMKSGNLRPGEMINIRQLSGELGVSRTTLKDALLGLQAEGFVVFLPQRGVRIPEITVEELDKSYQIIGALEASVLLLESTDFPASFFPTLSECNDLMFEASTEGISEQYWNNNFRFHDTILELSTNRQLVSIVHNLRTRIYEFPELKTFNWDWGKKCTEEHRKIVSLLEEGKNQEAAIFLQTTHWSFKDQWPYIEVTYFKKV